MILNQYVTVITSVCTAEKTYICPNDFLILGVWEHVVKQSVVLEQAEDIDTKHLVSNITCAIALENVWSFILQCNSNISPLVASLKSSYRLAIVKQTNKQANEKQWPPSSSPILKHDILVPLKVTFILHHPHHIPCEYTPITIFSFLFVKLWQSLCLGHFHNNKWKVVTAGHH